MSSDRTRRAVAAILLVVAGCGGDDEPASAPDPAPDTVDAGPSTTAAGGVPDASGPATDESLVLMVSGTISADPPSAEFAPTRLLPTTKVLDVAPGPWTLAIATDAGTIEIPFDVIEQADGDAPSARFSVPVQPAPADPIRRLAVSYEGTEVGAANGGDTLPSIRVTAPAPGTTVTVDEFEIEWESDTATTAAAYLTVDGGTSWTSVATQAADSPIRPAPGIAEPSTDAFVLVTVSDGVNAAVTRVGPFILTAG